MAGSGVASAYGGERLAAVMWPEVSANVWLGVFLGFGLLTILIAYRKYVVGLVSGKHSITGILHYRQRRNERMRRIAEVTVMHYAEDPEQRGRIAEKIRERWEKEDEVARDAKSGRSK